VARGVDDAPDLVAARDVFADREFALVAAVHGDDDIGGDVLRDVAAPSGIAQDRLDGAENLLRQEAGHAALFRIEQVVQSAKAATQTIPIVFTANGDPVGQGLVASLNRPGGNVTGITIFGDVTVTKRLQLLQELVPQAAAIAYLMNPTNLNGDTEMRAAQTAARCLG